jgi:hypothetical protein
LGGQTITKVNVYLFSRDSVQAANVMNSGTDGWGQGGDSRMHRSTHASKQDKEGRSLSLRLCIQCV